jgi:hypothetical protein
MRFNSWKVANIKTSRLMAYIATGEQEGWLDTQHIQNFSCPVLRTIDKLWKKYSDNKFGFSVQKAILDNILEQPGNYDTITDKTWSEFGIRVGWIVETKAKDGYVYDQLTFNPQKAKPGHLPNTFAGYLLVDEPGWRPFLQMGVPKDRTEFFSRAAICRL